MPAKTVSTTLVIPMSFEKLTKNMVRYAADELDAAVTTVYISKAAFQESHPREITLSIRVEE